MELTDLDPSPRIFRLWSAIQAVSACGERKVWTKLGRMAMYPNLYVFLIGPPGTGKTVAINAPLALLMKSKAVIVAPDDASKQGLLDALMDASRSATIEGKLADFHYCSLHVVELSDFMASYDIDIAGVLTSLYDCPSVREERKRTHGDTKLINRPGLGFIMGSSTQNLGNTISNEMWGSGFMARVIIIYSSEEVVPLDMFAEVPDASVDDMEIIEGFKKIGALTGPFTWSPEAQAALVQFRAESKDGAPLHNRLASYHTRRWFHLGKLVMTAALSEFTLSITLSHFLLAQEWLLEAEAAMPEVFKDMISHEDGAIYDELQRTFFLYQIKHKAPITHAMITDWLRRKVASHQVNRIIQIAISADILRRVAGTVGDDAEYKVMPPDGHKPGRI